MTLQNFLKLFETMSIKINELDFIRKIIKSGVMFHLKKI